MQGVRYYHDLLTQFRSAIIASRAGFRSKPHSGLPALQDEHEFTFGAQPFDEYTRTQVRQQRPVLACTRADVHEVVREHDNDPRFPAEAMFVSADTMNDGSTHVHSADCGCTTYQTRMPSIASASDTAKSLTTGVPRMAYGTEQQKTAMWAEYVLAQLDENYTKRVLFDERQAAVFADLDIAPTEAVLAHVHPPFPRTYIEFTHPIATQSCEPGYREEIRAMIVREIDTELPPGLVAAADDAGIKSESLRLMHLGVFLSSWRLNDDGTESLVWTDRWWYVDITSGGAWTRAGNLLAGTADVSELPAGIDPMQFVFVGALAPRDTPDGGWTEVASGDGGRHRGWYERVQSEHTALALWCLAFLVAKSTHLVTEPVSRQVRRYHERSKTPLPKPWHVVKIQPSVSTAPNAIPGPTRDGPRYRFDVIGHLRLNRKRLRDGTHKEVVEWVPAHQRGVQHALYIPKTYLAERGGRSLAPQLVRAGFSLPAAADGADDE